MPPWLRVLAKTATEELSTLHPPPAPWNKFSHPSAETHSVWAGRTGKSPPPPAALVAADDKPVDVLGLPGGGYARMAAANDFAAHAVMDRDNHVGGGGGGIFTAQHGGTRYSGVCASRAPPYRHPPPPAVSLPPQATPAIFF